MKGTLRRRRSKPCTVERINHWSNAAVRNPAPPHPDTPPYASTAAVLTLGVFVGTTMCAGTPRSKAA
eukprot:365040-Chlamydomonas_euryale.AAC.6